MQYKVLVHNFRLGDKTYTIGDVVEETSDRSWSRIVKLKQVEEVKNPAEIAKIVQEKELTNDEEYVIVDLVPQIVEGTAGWLYVEVNGERIGKATRDKEEAQRIVDEWLASND